MAGLLVGIVGGLLAAVVALALGAGAMMAFAAYSLGGAAAMLLFLACFALIRRLASWRDTCVAMLRPIPSLCITYLFRSKAVNRRT